MITASVESSPTVAYQQALERALLDAVDEVAPAWPQHRLLRTRSGSDNADDSVDDILAKLDILAQVRTPMPMPWYLEQYQAGAFGPRDMQEAISYLEVHDLQPQDVVTGLSRLYPAHSTSYLLVDTIGEICQGVPASRWKSLLTRQVHETCAGYFRDLEQSVLAANSDSLYTQWHRHLVRDRRLHANTKVVYFGDFAADLPTSASAVFATLQAELRVPPDSLLFYLRTLVRSVQPWASRAAFVRWEEAEIGAEDSVLHELLAIRLAWDLLLWRIHREAELAATWQRVLTSARVQSRRPDDQRCAWIAHTSLQVALERRVAKLGRLSQTAT